MRDVRKRKGVTQVALERASGVSARTIYRIETGREHMPKLRTLEKLAAALDVDPRELIGPRAPHVPATPRSAHLKRESAIAAAEHEISLFLQGVPTRLLRAELRRREIATELAREARERGVTPLELEREAVELYERWRKEGRPKGISWEEWASKW